MNHKKNIVLTGITGSVGRFCCDVVRQNPDMFSVTAVSGFSNLDLLETLCEEFKPAAICVGDGNRDRFSERFKSKHYRPNIYEGIAGLNKISSEYGNTVVAGISGGVGVHPVHTAVDCGKTVALANKESLVLAGKLIMKTAKKKKSVILPMDSEHNAIYQALGNNRTEDIDHIILTSSGGPFLNTPKSMFADITPEQALKHPNWSMGRKITIDSATMMNKALEIIEAAHLFGLPPEKIKVVIHPQVVVHSAVVFKDCSMLAQLGVSDMRIPVAYCLGHRKRIYSGSKKLDLTALSGLHFYEPDFDKYPTIRYAYEILTMDDSAAAVFNGANEALVDAFLSGNIRFTDIFGVLAELMVALRKPAPQNTSKHALLFGINTVNDAVRANDLGMKFAHIAINNNPTG